MMFLKKKNLCLLRAGNKSDKSDFTWENSQFKKERAVGEGEGNTKAENAWQHINITTRSSLRQRSSAPERAHLSNALLSIKY